MLQQPRTIPASRSILIPFALVALILLPLVLLIYLFFVPKSQGGPAITAAPTQSVPPTPTPLQQLENLAKQDFKAVKKSLLNSWAAQLASAPIGKGDSDTLSKHIELQKKYGALLARSDSFTTYQNLDEVYWITVLPTAFGSESEASTWCINSGRGDQGCRPTYLRHN